MDLVLKRVFSRIVHRGSLVIVSSRGTRLIFGDGSGSPVVACITDRRAEVALVSIQICGLANSIWTVGLSSSGIDLRFHTLDATRI